MNRSFVRTYILPIIAAVALGLVTIGSVYSQEGDVAGGGHSGGEASLILPDLSSAQFLGLPGTYLLYGGLLVSGAGLFFGLRIATELKNLPVHSSMREVSELIYETCKTYLVTQGKFLAILWAIIAVVIVMYFGWLERMPANVVAIIIAVVIVMYLVG